MIHLTRSLIRRWLDRLLHIDDTPERTAAAFALGVFFGFSPFLGLHTLLGILFAFLLNLNRVSVLLGVYSNLPWFLGPYYVVATMVGAQITGHRLPPGFRMQLRNLFELSLFHGEFWHRLGRGPQAARAALRGGVDDRRGPALGGVLPPGARVHRQPPPAARHPAAPPSP